MSPMKRPLFWALCALLLIPMPTHAGEHEPDASHAPAVSGPLVGDPFGCEDQGKPGPGESWAQACLWSYTLVGDTDTQRDFGVTWIQAEIEPGPGKNTCAKSIKFRLDELNGIELISAAPVRSTRVKKRTERTTAIVADAAGNAPVAGEVSQRVLWQKGRTVARFRDDSFMFRWTGNSPDKVVIAAGVQLAHEGPIPEVLFNSWTESLSFDWGSCDVKVLTG